MTEYTIESVTPGEPWGCRFRINTMLDQQGHLVDTTGIQMGEGLPTGSQPGVYESIGVIRIRDADSKQLVIQDTSSPREFVVSYADVWDIDRVEYTPE